MSATGRVYETLRCLLDDDGIPPTTRTIAEAAGCAPSTVHEALDRLEAEGLIARSNDGRRLIVPLWPGVYRYPGKSRMCGWCGAILEGRRSDARYCCDSHRVLASKARRAG